MAENIGGITELGAAALSGGLSFLGNLGGSIGGGLFSANQAKKNRAFQERMYNKQVEDNFNFWKMQADYNNPSAALQRIQDAGLNPLLYYSDGQGISGNLTSAPASATAPHGAQGQVSSFHSPIELANLALLHEQADNLRADSELKRSQAQEHDTRVDWYQSTKGMQYLMYKREYEKLDFEIHQIATSTNMLADMTWKNLEVLDKSMEMMDKHYNLSERDLERQIAYNLADIAVRNREVDATLKKIAVETYNAVTQRKLALSVIARNAEEVKKIMSDTKLTDQERQLKLHETINQFLHNVGYADSRTENVNGMAGALLLLTGTMFGRSEQNDADLKQLMKELGVDDN